MMTGMGKRNALIVLSSDDDEFDQSFGSKGSYTKVKSGSRVTSGEPRRVKKARRLSGSRCRVFEEPCNVAEIQSFCEDFDQVFYGSKASAGPRSGGRHELWVDKYEPHSLEELAVHRKKVEEVKMWFEERLKTSKSNIRNRVVIISGPAGVGKSATIHVIASHLRVRLCEWTTPTPVIWQEHLHNSSGGIRYTSKLDEFENFVERTRKYGVLSSSSAGVSKSAVILLIDDLPLTNGKTAFRRLQNCLHLLVQSTQVPTAILISDCSKADSGDLTARCLEELQLGLENAGAFKVSFNPITKNSIRKTLSRICQLEQCNLTAEQIDAIAETSGGDIRHAITSLQFFCTKPTPVHSLSLSSPTTYLKEKYDDSNHGGDGLPLQIGRDETLSLFHALGKFLHNKRDAEKALPQEEAAFLVHDRFSRLPLKMDVPEKILCQAHGQARPITDFLHENVLDFLNEEAMEDASAVVSYLGDADLLLASFTGILSRCNEAENAVQSAAASVAVRGVLFGNSHPLSSRWHAIRRPKLWQVEESALSNKNELVKQKFIAYNGPSSSDTSVVACDYSPLLKWLRRRSSVDCETAKPFLGSNETQGQLDMQDLDDQESEISDDDEIEDW